jgi:outer membrane protein assembly factor BamB
MARRHGWAVIVGCGLVMNAALTLSESIVRGDDWPHWMGPQRDNVWREEGVLETFPKDGLKPEWETPIAGGYAGPAVAQGKVVVTDFVTGANVKVDNFDRASSTGTERVLCLDEATGTVLWKHEYPQTYGISYPAGPRCTPIIEGEFVYTLGAEGRLLCLRLADGKVAWGKDLKAEYKTKSALWGYASHPLIDGQKLICVVGTSVAHAVAFDKLTGKELWRTNTAPEQGYSPPTIIEAGGVRQLVLLKPDGVYAADPETGKVLWETDYDADNGSIIMTPLKIDDYLYVGGWQEKNLLLKLKSDRPGVDVVFRNKARHGLSPVNVQPFVDGNVIYGFHEKGDLRAIEIPSGQILWRTAGPLGDRPQGSATAFMVKHGDRFWMFTEKGDLVIAKLDREGYHELDRTAIIAPTNFAFGRDVVWCPPAYANRAIYVRNDAQIRKISLAAP